MAMPLSKLKTLCGYGDGWSYAVFWRFHPQNPLLLTVEESYYEDQLGEEIINMLPQVHFLGEGIVGEAAFTGKHSWVHLDCHTQQLNIAGLNSFEDQQFSSGIKTIVVIPVKAMGVVQFGSKNKILERMDFLEQAQSLLMEMDDMNIIDVSENAVLSIDFDDYDLNGLLASISSENSCDWNRNFEELIDVYSSASHNNPFSSQQYETCEEVMTSLEVVDSSFLGDHLKDTVEAHLEPNSSMNSLIAKNNCSGEVSSVDMLGQIFSSDIWEQEVLADANVLSSSNTLHGLSKSLEPIDMSEEILNFSSMDDLCQWFAPSPEDSIFRTAIQLDNTLSDSVEFNATCSDFSDIPMTCLAEHNSMTTAVNSDGKETSVVMHGFENDLLDNIEFDFDCDQGGEWWGNIVAPVENATIDTGFSECIPELNTSTMSGTRKRLFSELGIEELLRGEENYNPFNCSSFGNDLSSNKRNVVEFSPVNKTRLHFANLAGTEARASFVQPVCDIYKSNSFLSKKDTGATKKRARPGESTRSRPKDRQQIQDCIKELRRIIPNGGKCSIDSLLDCTIRYLIFLRGVTKYADMLKEPNEPKLIEQAKAVGLKDSIVGDNENRGATWAFEVGNQTMVCPVIVEDRNSPGQMLIEMLCEEQGFFLEIVDIIRGFGLNILKGKMEIRKNKLWASFIVEANIHVTRIDVFWSLIQLLQQTNTSGIDSANKHWNVC